MIHNNKRIAVIGGGISGLTASYYLMNGVGVGTSNANKYQITLYEKNDRFGGNIKTTKLDKQHCVVEQGPRSIRAAGTGINTLDLVNRLGLENELIFASKKSNGKFLLLDGEIQELPSPNKLLKSIQFVIGQGIVSSFLAEPFKKVPKDVVDKPDFDESIHSFFKRRLGSRVADIFVEPMCLGIHGGDYKKLSIRACFPSVANREISNNSLLGLNLFGEKSDKTISTIPQQLPFLLPEKQSIKEILDKDLDKTGVFSFENGLNTLISSLVENLRANGVKLNHSTTIQEIRTNDNGKGYKIIDKDGNVEEFDQIISTIPFTSLYPMFNKSDKALEALLRSIPYTSISVLNLVYKNNASVADKIKDKGFGYLVPSKEKVPVLGVCFDSNTFPEFIDSDKDSIITVMIGGNQGIKDRNAEWINVDAKDKDDLLNIAKKHLKKYLDIKDEPDWTNVEIYQNGIPHYEVGHQQRIRSIQSYVEKNYGDKLVLGGNALDGVSINDSIFKSKSLVYNLLENNK
ncbi:hypothetical protein CYY_001333 [Polysphondylium violaceum]|uniref:Protoporphyrinogen oxidase n=1 Tax=Polysphondylium violaceum TaxID=133409 RepID=A0A8J4Q167_9MYCE|nr:hypothetical protein CYY_001333 [Polysphondylium violaceum]